MIYFLRNPRTRLIKIGTTEDFYRRHQALNKKHKTDLKLMGWIEGKRKEEQALHTQFSQFRATSEWFNPHPDLLAFIKTNCNKSVPDKGMANITIYVPVEVLEALKSLNSNGEGIIARHVKNAVYEYLYKRTGRKFYGL